MVIIVYSAFPLHTSIYASVMIGVSIHIQPSGGRKMKLPVYKFFSIFIMALSLFACSKTPQQQVEEYMKLYYPSTTGSYYSIVFDWGSYEIITSDPVGTKVHEDSKPYLGYITMRPDVKGPTGDFKPAIYLITPEGVVWSAEASTAIAKEKERKEVTVTKTDFGSSTSTSTINAANEPIIDHFKANAAAWKKYGTLKSTGGAFSDLSRVK